MLFGDGILVSRQGEPFGPHHVDSIDLRELVLLDYHILQPASFFRRSSFSPGDLNETYVCAFDADFFIGKISRGEKYSKVAKPFAAFRLHDASKTVAMQEQKCGTAPNKQNLLPQWIPSARVQFLPACRACTSSTMEQAMEPAQRACQTFARAISYFLIVGWPSRRHA